MIKRSFNLRSYLTLYLVLTITALTVILGFTIWYKTSEYIKNDVGQNLAESAYLMSDKLDHYMWSRSAELAVLTSLDVLKTSNKLDQVQRIVDELQHRIPAFSWIGYLSPQGDVLAASNKMLLGQNIAQRPVFNQATEQPFFGDVHEAVLLANLLPNPSGEPMKFVDISYPIFDQDNKLTGILAAHLSWNWAQEVRNLILSPFKQHKQLEMLVISKQDNRIILGPQKELGQILSLDSIELARKGENAYRIETWPDGKPYITGFIQTKGYQNYPGLDWTILSRQPLNQAFYAVNELQLLVWLIGGLFALIFAFISWQLASRISRPLEAISRSAKQISQGNNIEIPLHRGLKDIEVLSNSLHNMVQNLTQTESALANMKELAHHDHLTGLPNRVALDEYLKKTCAKAMQNQASLTFFYMDLDKFKEVNDKHGHNIGDLLLKEVAQRLHHNIKSSDYLVRLGGDEFLLILMIEKGNLIEVATDIANRIIEHLNQPFIIEQHSLSIGCTIGAASWPNDHLDPLDVIHLADQTLFKAKEAGRNCVLFHNHES